MFFLTFRSWSFDCNSQTSSKDDILWGLVTLLKGHVSAKSCCNTLGSLLFVSPLDRRSTLPSPTRFDKISWTNNICLTTHIYNKLPINIHKVVNTFKIYGYKNGFSVRYKWCFYGIGLSYKIVLKQRKPGDSKWPFDPLVGGHQQPLKGSRFHHSKKVTIAESQKCQEMVT